MCLIVCDLEPSKRGGLGPIWAVATQKKSKLVDSKITGLFGLLLTTYLY